ncbi:MAG TPA: hypothetical protein VFY61_19120 [Pyrinomonadaceae bacterium]|nr:hypothetical protein [Pyrinomonadaceae bacterium]
MRRILERMKRSMSIFARDLEPLMSLLLARFIVWRVMRREVHH